MKARLGAAFLLARPLTKRPSFLGYPRAFSLSTESSSRIITYLTDVEGDSSYLDRYVHQSKVLHFRACSQRSDDFPYDQCIDFNEDNTMLVYGGDVWDRGGSDLYVIRQLLDLQRRHQGRVHFIMGNRDLNKMRILSELGCTDEKMPTHEGVYWLKGTGRLGDPLLNTCVAQSSSSQRLKWMLAQTMGSPNAFELRRNELQRERGQHVTDEDVVASYRRSCHPTGEMGQYLKSAHLALRLGSILFLHGALPLTHSTLKQVCEQDVAVHDFWTDFKFAMPWSNQGSTNSNPRTVDEWLEALEKFARDRVSKWQEYVTKLENEPGYQQDRVWSTRGGYNYWPSGQRFEDLIQYGMGWTPDRRRNPTVVYSSWLKNGLPVHFLPDVSSMEDVMYASLTAEFFKAASLQLIVSGHQPHGDMPMPIRIGESQCVLCCDTSYSADTIWWNQDEGEGRTNVGRGSGSSGRGDVAVR